MAEIERKGARRGREVAKPAPEAINVDDDKLIEDAAAEEAAARAAAAKKELDAKLEVIKADAFAALDRIENTEQSSALEVRAAWVVVGRDMLKARSLFKTADGTLNNKGFNGWLKAAGFEARIEDRNMRTDAMWLAELHDSNPDLYALIPSEGSSARRSPKTIKRWHKDTQAEVFEAIYNDVGEVKTDEAGKPVKDDAIGAVQDMQTVLRDRADAAENAGVAEHNNYLADFVAYSVPEDLGLAYAAWKPKAAGDKFEEMSPEDAAKRLLTIMCRHPEAAAVFENLCEIAEAGIAAAQDAKAKAETEKAEKEAEKARKKAEKNKIKAAGMVDPAEDDEADYNDEDAA